jgi:hypothetical protein
MSVRESGVWIFKLGRWSFLGCSVLSLALMLRRPAAVAQSLPAAAVQQNADQFQAKWAELEQASLRGEPAEARFSAEEINAAFEQSAVAQGSQTANADIHTGQIRPAQVSFAGDHVTGQFVANLRGKDVYVTVSGQLGAADGYVTFTPTEMKIGDLPVPVSLVNPQLQSRLMQPEIHEKLKLPEHVAALRIQDGQLVVVEK